MPPGGILSPHVAARPVLTPLPSSLYIVKTKKSSLKLYPKDKDLLKVVKAN